MKKVLVATLSSIILGTTLVSCADTKTNSKIEESISVSTSEIVEDVKKEIGDNIRKTALVEEEKISEFYQIELEAVEEAKIVTKNNYIALFVIPDEEGLGLVDTAVKAFENSIN